MLFLGTGDLSVDLGVCGHYDSPAFQQQLEQFFQSARDAKKWSGLYSSRPKIIKQATELGATLLVCGSDLLFLHEGAIKCLKNHS
jgi:2-keto-3-deoxy-L-rhamnonate aldolase RhmA